MGGLRQSTSFALLVYIASIPLFAFNPDFVFMTRLSGLLLGLFWLVDLVQRQSRFYFARPYVALVAWFAWACLGLILKGVDPNAGLGRLISVGLNLVMMVIISSLVKQGGERLFNRIVLTFGFASLLLLLSGLPSVTSVAALQSHRFDAGTYNPNHASFIFAIGAICLLHQVLTMKRVFHGFLLAPAIVLLVLGILLTGSRQGIVVFGVGALVVTIFGAHRWRVVVMLGVVLVAGMLFLPQIERSGSLRIEVRAHRLLEFVSGDTDADQSARARLQLIEAGWNMFRHNPVLGVGPEQVRSNIVEFGGPWATYAHNNYIEILGSGGLIGFALYYGVVVTTFWRALTGRRTSPVFVLSLGLVSAIMAGDLFRVSYYQKVETTMLATAIGMHYHLGRDRDVAKARVAQRLTAGSAALHIDEQARQ